MSRPLAVVTGLGPGTGSAIVRRLSAGGYGIAMLARNRERLAALETEIDNAKAYACDVTDDMQLDTALAAVRRDLGEASLPVHNAVGGPWGPGPLLSDTWAQEFPRASAHFGRVIGHPAFAPDVGPYLKRLERTQHG